jgi:hypothetical protein
MTRFAHITLTDIFTQAGAELRLFDMGRRVDELGAEAVAQFEAGNLAYPTPLRQHAWTALEFHFGDQLPTVDSPPNVWFLRFPLDETGCLKQVARDDIVRRLSLDVVASLETARSRAAASTRDDDVTDTGLGDNPFGFTPAEARLAIYRAKAGKRLGWPPTEYYAHALEYVSGRLGREQYAFVGVQGLADLSARLGEDGNEAVLAACIEWLPTLPLSLLCECLEHERVTSHLAEQLLSRLHDAERNSDRDTMIWAMRALSWAEDPQLTRRAVFTMLECDWSRDVEVLAAVAGRAWAALGEPSLHVKFFECLADNTGGQQGFDAVASDLMFIPSIQAQLRDFALSGPQSPRLRESFGRFIESTRSNQSGEQM